MSTRLALPARRAHITQKVKIAGQRTLYLSIHDDEQPAEIFLRLKEPDCSSELIGLYDVIARLMSLALQYGAPLEKVGDLLTGAQFTLCGPVSGHDRSIITQDVAGFLTVLSAVLKGFSTQYLATLLGQDPARTIHQAYLTPTCFRDSSPTP